MQLEQCFVYSLFQSQRSLHGISTSTPLIFLGFLVYTNNFGTLQTCTSHDQAYEIFGMQKKYWDNQQNSENVHWQDNEMVTEKVEDLARYALRWMYIVYAFYKVPKNQVRKYWIPLIRALILTISLILFDS
jgi:hypothetical protein